MFYYTKKVNIVRVLAVLGKYTVLAIKLIPVLLQNVLKKAMGCTCNISGVLAIIDVLASTKKKKLNII